MPANIAMQQSQQKLIKLKDLFYQKYWPDPVWSKVISAAIITAIGSTFTTIYVLLESLYKKVPFNYVVNQIIEYFKLTTEVNNVILWPSFLILIWVFYSFFKSFIKDIINKIKTKNSVIENIEEPKELPTITEHSTVFFSYRLTKVFPKQRSLVWY